MNVKKVLCCLLALFMVAAALAGCNGGTSSSSSPEASPAAESSESSAASGEDAAPPESESESESSEATEGEPVTISIGNWPTPEKPNYEYMEGLKEAFMDKYPHITMTTDDYAYAVDTFLPKAASGQLPNLYSTWFTETNKIIDAGYAEDITDTMNKYNILDSVNPDLMPLLGKDDRYYAIPISAYSMAMIYHVPLFEEAGLMDENDLPILPKTWDEVAETAAVIKEKTGKNGFFYPTKNNQGGWMFMNLAWSYGAEFEKQVDGKWTAVFDSPEAVAALQYLKDLKWKYDVLPANTLLEIADLHQMFGTDQVGIAICAIDQAPNIIKATGCSVDIFAASTTPEGPAGKAALLGGSVYFVAPGTTTAQQDAIMKWLEFRGESPVFTEESKQGFEDGKKNDAEQGFPVGPQGVRIWTSQERLAEEDAIIDKYINVDMRLWESYSNHASENVRAEEPVNVQELYKVLDSVIQEVLTNENADPQELLTKACQDFQKDYLDKAN
ncbi:MAG: ABC transporter substrate-binding protein [Oscillospiraceae bacterium]